MILLEDVETVNNVFFDRSFKEQKNGIQRLALAIEIKGFTMLYQNTGAEYPVLASLALIAIPILIYMPMTKPVIAHSGCALERYMRIQPDSEERDSGDCSNEQP